MNTYAYGFPRIGKNREHKKIIEGFWDNGTSPQQLHDDITCLEQSILATYTNYVDNYPVGEMTLYDNMLDTALMLNIHHARDLEQYFDLCHGAHALELTKWFNTNYHYLVPQLNSSAIASIHAAWNKPREAWERHKQGIPYLVGPFTFLKLCKGMEQDKLSSYAMAIASAYQELISGFSEVHIDEPAFVMELSPKEITTIKEIYHKLGTKGCRINLFTYYGSVDFLEELYQLPVAAIGLDMINGSANLDSIKRTGFPNDKTLIAGIVNGRNVWRTNIGSAAKMVQELSQYAKHITISNASPLYHLPVTIKGEALDPRLLNQMAFAEERLYELQLIAHTCEGNNNNNWNQNAGNLGIDPGVRDRMSKLTASDFIRTPAYSQRVQKQRDSLHLPLFPTSTIGSFPQSPEVRRERAKFRRGEITTSQYQSFIRDNISSLIHQQEELDLDVLVHGEFERTDMVEFFAEKLEGIATTKNGWILSYGTRGYRPPIIYGDISRPQPMSLDEIVFAQSLTPRPVKGMLTGPITIIAWSFVREDIPTSQVAYQISLCLKDEISDYERNGIRIVQIDEPAFREKAPIKKRDWKNYFDWAVKSFRLCSSQVKPETQIQTHMCYSEFGEIIEQITQMDFDVITIETSRSKGDILEYFEKVNFDRQIGLGVWDIHSPAIPSVASMREVTGRALQVLPRENMWINPDCGLKTRKWQEVLPSLRNMITLAQELRKEAQG